MDTIKMQRVTLPDVGTLAAQVRAANTNLPPRQHATVPEMRAACAKVLRFLPPIPREDIPDDVA